MTDTEPRTVLYVEDDRSFVLLVQRALQRAKLDKLPNLRVFSTVEGAMSYLMGQAPYDDRSLNPLPTLVLTDLRLPGKSGLQLLKWIRQQTKFQDLPVVMLTGSAVDADIEEAYDLGVNFCLVKPTDVETLISIIQALSIYWVPPPTRRIRPAGL